MAHSARRVGLRGAAAGHVSVLLGDLRPVCHDIPIVRHHAVYFGKLRPAERWFEYR